MTASNPATTPSAAAVSSGLSVNRLPSTDALAGTRLLFTLQDGTPMTLDFDHSHGCAWSNIPGITLAGSGRATVDVVEGAPGVYFIDLLLPDMAMQTADVIVDMDTRHALVVSSSLNEPVERRTRLSQQFTTAIVGDASTVAIGPKPAPTRDLIDHRALYHYSPDTTYEHIYINSNWYAYQCVNGVRRGDCGCDHASYYKIADDVYVVAWREILIDIAAVFVYDMKAKRTTGKAWGVIGKPLELRNVPAGAFIEPLHGAGYPAGIVLV
jgi:molybdenum cofactor biosynthesis protein MoaF